MTDSAVDLPPAGATAPDRVAAALDELRRLPALAGRIVHEERIEARQARHAPWPAALHPLLVEALHARGVERPYSHQADAVERALAGRDVVVVTPTASGKSLCYILPVLDAWLRDPEARSLWLFPWRNRATTSSE